MSKNPTKAPTADACFLIYSRGARSRVTKAARKILGDTRYYKVQDYMSKDEVKSYGGDGDVARLTLGDITQAECLAITAEVRRVEETSDWINGWECYQDGIE